MWELKEALNALGQWPSDEVLPAIIFFFLIDSLHKKMFVKATHPMLPTHRATYIQTL